MSKNPQTIEELHPRLEHRLAEDCAQSVIAVAKFDDMQEFIEFYEELKAKKIGAYNTVLNTSSPSWRFGERNCYGKSNRALTTEKGITESAKKGYCQNIFSKMIDDYRNKINASNVGKLNDEVKSIKRVTRFTDDGAELDIDRVMCGDMEYWRTTKRDGDYRVVRLVINFGMSAGNGIQSFMKVLATTYVIAEILDRKGYGVEIYGTNCAESYDSDTIIKERAILIPLKKAQEGLDIERMGVVGLSGFFRHHSFVVAEELFGHSNGYARPTSKKMRHFLGADIFVDNSWSRGDDERQAIKITKALEKIEGRC